MKLPPEEVETFYRIQTSLLCFVNQQLELFPKLKTPADLRGNLTLEEIFSLREALYEDLELLDEFLAANPHGLTSDQLQIASSWRYFRAGELFLYRYLKRYTVFLDTDDPPRAYGVLGLHHDFDELIPLPPPVLVDMVLLPFRDKIVFDGIFRFNDLYFGSGFRQALDDAYRQAKERFGVLTTLLPGAEEVGLAGSDGRVLRSFRRWLMRRGLRPQTVEKHVANLQAFSTSYLATKTPPRILLDVCLREVLEWLEALPTDLRRKDVLVSLRKFFKFLEETGRMSWEKTSEVRRALREL